MLAVDWDNLAAVGAFGLGAVLGIIVSLRLFRIAVDLVRHERDKNSER